MSAQTHKIGIVMNGVTGRMGLNQHLRRSLDAIIRQGGIALNDREAILPHLLLVGRSPAKLDAIGKESGGLPWNVVTEATCMCERSSSRWRKDGCSSEEPRATG